MVVNVADTVSAIPDTFMVFVVLIAFSVNVAETVPAIPDTFLAFAATVSAIPGTILTCERAEETK